MAVSWSDIQKRAEQFALDYKDAKDEDRDAKPFWQNLMTVFGVEARSIGAFEERVRVYERPGVARIDYFAPRKFLIEHKSRGKDLDAAYRQALDYFDALPRELKPRYIIVSDFARIQVHDLEADAGNKTTEFTLEELPNHIRALAFFTDEEVREYKPEEHIDVKAVRVIGKLYDALKMSNYTPDHLPRLLTRLVFCFFADDIGIFEKNSMRRYLEDNTKADGSDIGDKLNNIFSVLDTPDGSGGSKNLRQKGMDDTLAALPYVNGGMFAGSVNVVFGSREVREMILQCLAFDWSYVSPAIFGSMFQSVLNEKERHDLGAHYTSETNILKVINGLFLEDIQAELESAGTAKAKLDALWERIAGITLLDPACGCGNFLVVAFRELRAIENEIIRRIYGKESKLALAHATSHARLDLGEVDLQKISKLSIERMFGIEIEPFPVEVAKLSLWLVDHKMNIELGRIFGKVLRKLPLKEQPHIVCDNALRMDWESVVPKEKLTYILGNPPFIGSKVMNDDQRAELAEIFGKGGGVLDYVSGWYLKAARLIQGTNIDVAFVSTNSITQGEQVGILWKEMIEKYGVKISFAHRTFKWSNEAPGKAAVYCVIIGFGLHEPDQPKIYEYADVRGEPHEVKARHINPYLVDAPDVFIISRSKPICGVPDMGIGNKPIDDGLYLFTTEEKTAFIKQEPDAKIFFRRWLGSDEFLNGWERWCLWLGEAKPEELKRMPEVMRRIEGVRLFRSMSKSAPTRKLAETPTRFHVENIQKRDYLLIPRVSSERRLYVPIGFMSPDTLSSDSVHIIPNATLYHFGVLESEMHMAWMRAVCGRLESRYRYSKDIVYNNFPWPEEPTDAQKKAVEDAAQAVLDARRAHQGATLADLYDPNTMPKDLLDAHHKLDRAVDACYGKSNFKSEPERLEFLFEQYKRIIQRIGH